MSRLEAHARILMRAYPPGYRAERGEDIIGTLLEASPPDRRWLAAREALSLVAAGLRVRAAANRRQPAATSLRLVLLLAAALWLSWEAYEQLGFLTVSPQGNALSLLGGLLVSVTIAAPWFAPRVFTVLLAGGTAITLALAYAQVDQPPRLIYLAPQVIPPLTLAVAAAAGPSRPPPAWLWLPGALAAASILRYTQDMVISPLASSIIGLAVGLIASGVVAAAVLWLTVDVRPVVAFLIGWEWLLGPTAAFAASRGIWLTGPYYVALAVPVAALGAVLTIRRLASQSGGKARRTDASPL
jgi:hypothetical protein